MNMMYTYISLLISLSIIGGGLYVVYNLLKRALQSNDTDPIVQDLILQIAKWMSFTYLGIIILENAGVSVGPLLATLGVTGVAIGFAVKDIISNIVCGVLIIIYRPFKAGDKIIIKDWQGIVQTINIRNTIIKHENMTILVPNTKMYSETIAIIKE